MNGKQAKTNRRVARRLLKNRKDFSEETNYHIKQHKRLIKTSEIITLLEGLSEEKEVDKEVIRQQFILGPCLRAISQTLKKDYKRSLKGQVWS